MLAPAGVLLDRNSELPIFEQICAAIRSRIRSGGLGSGARLPATRALAADLGVARATVVTAYEQLVAEGYLAARRGSGYRVCAMGEVELPPDVRPPPVQELTVQGPLLLEAGEPDMRLFPHGAWAKCVSRLCRTRPTDLLTGCGPFGHPQLRQAIAAHVRDWRGIAARPEQVFVTSGATEALDLCLSALASGSGTIGVEDPGFPPIRQFAEAQGHLIRDLCLDDQGAEVPTVGDGTDVVALTPSHQYPLGGAMSAGRRQSFVAWAAQSQGWIIEDDYDSEFRYAGRPIPALASVDSQGRTVYIGSFSKIFSNGLRLGYIVAPDRLVEQMRRTILRKGARASAMPQAALADFMLQGEFYRHLRRVRRVYAERHRTLIERLGRDFADVGEVVDHHAGMQVVLHLRPGLSDSKIAAEARKNGVGVDALSSFSRRAGAFNGAVLGACLNDLDEQQDALQRLRRVISSTE
ncbi:MocR-like pyridoxine biosynthesis transcription factor PdxR [Tritonibacter horizontis]|uniref:HTH-type transcriptional regulatory protein GabR n=1 Tax=Tritonibacter horizontis TaxID=1768241 RepID=A0A132BUJ5_9RHOB|nr:PLP-dependent aminotransferase family protein [Tritonibacter horizontis]KUP92055.1 HTH-type transcriptional regulatory protein GabR [Tritonibacter horizontis]